MTPERVRLSPAAIRALSPPPVACVLMACSRVWNLVALGLIAVLIASFI